MTACDPGTGRLAVQTRDGSSSSIPLVLIVSGIPQVSDKYKFFCDVDDSKQRTRAPLSAEDGLYMQEVCNGPWSELAYDPFGYVRTRWAGHYRYHRRAPIPVMDLDSSQGLLKPWI